MAERLLGTRICLALGVEQVRHYDMSTHLDQTALVKGKDVVAALAAEVYALLCLLDQMAETLGDIAFRNRRNTLVN